MGSINKIYFEHEGDLTRWEQTCLPIGNAYMGASMFGGVRKERIVLNEKTLWAGGPCEKRSDYYGGNKKGKYEYVKKVRALLEEGKQKEAEELLGELTGEADFGNYLLLFDAVMEFNIPGAEVTNYRRELDLDKSLYTCRFTVGGVTYTREAFASYPARVMAFKFTADSQGALDFVLTLQKTHDCEVALRGNMYCCSGTVEDNGMCFDARSFISTDGEVIANGSKLIVRGASEAVLYFAAATNYSDSYPYYRSGVDPANITKPLVEAAARLGWEALYNEHFNDYNSIFGWVSLKINEDFLDLPADTLIKEYKNGNRAAMNTLESLYFSYGRYLLISSSRTGSLPANLQGVWNESNTPPWCCDYHTNVNLQMNYWGAFNTNMPETVLPLMDFLNLLREPGRITAKEYYNIESTENHPKNGWTVHTQCSPFGWTAPGWDFYWGWSTAAAAWLMQNIWEYYEFTGDKETLKEKIYPIMEESARFYAQWLIYDKKQDRMVSSPTYSPEHGPVSIGNTYEQSLIEQLFLDYISASKALEIENDLTKKAKEILPMLKPYHIGKTGMLKEWYNEDDPDFDRSRVQKNHRHISHLMGLYPGKRINSSSPELMKAAIAVMNDRGDESTGWARAYKINLWARTGDGERTYKLLRGLLTDCTYDNLWDFHPPFQIDGNFGGTAGIAEMLIQSHEEFIKLLPAVPKEWESGEFKGLCARGGFVFNVRWKNGEIVFAEVTSQNGGVCRINYIENGGAKEKTLQTEKGKTITVIG